MFQLVNCAFIPCQQWVSKHDYFKAQYGHNIRQVKYYQLTVSKEGLYQFLICLKKKVFTIALLCSKSTDLMLFWKGVWGVTGIQFLFIHSFAQSYGNIVMRECFTWFWYIFNYIFKSYSKEGLLKYVQWANSLISIVTKIPDIINFGYWKLFPEDSE